MKLLKIILILLLIFTSNIIIKSQNNFKASYKLTYQPDSTSDYKLSERFLLYMNGELSQFISYNNALRDSLFLEINEGNLSIEEITQRTLNRPKSKFYLKINKIYSSDKIEVLDEIMTNLYKYEQPLNLMKWNLQDEFKNITGYKCQKAITSYAGRNYIAWFDTNIPISDGPYKFNGLPGLIISVYDTRNQYNFKLIGLEKDDFEIKRNLLEEDYQVISYEDYLEIQENYEANAEAMAKRVMSNMNGKPKSKGYKRNNPIELK